MFMQWSLSFGGNDMLDAILLGIALAMDSLSVSIVNGIKYKNYTKKQMFLASLSFGLFQGIMPLLGYLLSKSFLKYIQKIDHWLVFVILGLLGINMIKESFEKENVEERNDVFTWKILLLESIATAIDALSVGIALPTLELSPYLSCFIIFLCTFIICLLGHCLGKKIALLLKNKALTFGGLVLIFIGIKTLLEHLEIL